MAKQPILLTNTKDMHYPPLVLFYQFFRLGNPSN